MAAIYSSAALKTRQREVSDEARRNIVHITENGNAAFVLMSEELFDRAVNDAAERAAYEERVRACIRAGRGDVAEGRYVEGIDAFFSTLNAKVANHSKASKSAAIDSADEIKNTCDTADSHEAVCYG